MLVYGSSIHRNFALLFNLLKKAMKRSIHILRMNQSLSMWKHASWSTL